MKRKLALIVSSIIAVSGCSESGKDLTDFSTSNIPNNSNYVKADPTAGISNSERFNDYGVHDPSVIKVDGTYYIFGSHLAAAKSTDLMNWQEVSSLTEGNVDTSPLFQTYSTEIAEGIAWTDNFSGNWAANVIQAPNGKFWFYYNHCGQAKPEEPNIGTEVCYHRSYLGLAEADSIEGPYVNKGIFLRSGHRDGELATYPVDGVTEYNAAIHPNAIDPTTFYDKDGGLWMVYGSYSGGIFVLDIDETSGMPVAGQGFGKKLAGGDFNAMEGPFAFYSPKSDYYYLMWSNGGFADGEGYNVRVARSKTPDGPYLDAEGRDVIDARVNNNYGVKLIGSFNFDSPLGETATEWGYNAPGHNSAMYDVELDKHLFVSHTRFPVEQQAHENAHAVRVHEMWVNSDGWLVLSPHRYAPIEGVNYVDNQDIQGDYRIIFHENDTNTEEHQSLYINLSQGNHVFKGNISGAASGTYTFSENDSLINITIDGTNYNGVVKWQWNKGDERLEPVISAMSPTGEMIWAHKLEDKTPAELLADFQNAMADYFPTETEILSDGNFLLAGTGPRGLTVSWTSSNEYLVRRSGAIYQGPSDLGDQQVDITANVTYKGQSATYTETVTVKALDAINMTILSALPKRAHFSFDETLAEAGTLTNEGITFADGVAAANVAGDPATANYVDGPLGKAVNLDGSYGILLDPSVIEGNEYTVSFWLNQQEQHNFRPAVFSARSADYWQSFLPASWNDGLMMWSHWLEEDASFPWFDGTTSVVPYPINEWHHVAYSFKEGTIEIFYDGKLVGSAEGLEDMHTDKPDGSIITLGLNYWDPGLVAQFDELKVYSQALTEEEISALEYNMFTEDAQMTAVAKENLSIAADLTFVVADLPLTGTGMFASSVVWESSHPEVIDQFGYVTRPTRGNEDVDVTLTATITLAGITETKSFTAKVIAEGPPRPIARFSFEGNLADSTGNFADGQAAVNGLIPTDAATIYDTGIVGDAFSIAGGSSAGAKLPNNLITDHTYSFALWLKPNSLSQFTTAFFGAASANSWFSVVPYGPGAGNTMLWSGTAWFDGDSGVQIPVDAWTHFAVTVDGGKLSIYLNGELANELDGFPDVFTAASSSEFSLGINYWDVSFDGLIDELVIFAEPIEASDIKELFDEGQSAE